MVGQAEMDALMAGIGPRLELAEVTAFAERGAWTLVADPDTVLFADWDEGRRCVWLSAEAGAPLPGTDRAGLYGLLLQYNNQWAETGRVRMALDGPGGAVVMSCDLPAAELDLDRLELVVGNFLDKLGAWRAIVGRGAADRPGVDAGEASFDPTRAGFIRG